MVLLFQVLVILGLPRQLGDGLAAEGGTVGNEDLAAGLKERLLEF